MSERVGEIVHGAVAPGFEAVREAFERNFENDEETGASLGIYVDSREVVNLWGGYADKAKGRPWMADTIAISYSLTKGGTATLMNLLADRGELDLDAPIAEIWPEFAVEGKSQICTRDVLSHRAGLPIIEDDLDRDELISGHPAAVALARQEPLWTPSTAFGYHALTFGWLIGEIVRRATGKRVGELFADCVSGPLDIDFYIGCPDSEQGRIAPLVNADPPNLAEIAALPDPVLREQVEAMIAAASDPTSLISRTLNPSGNLPTPEAHAWNDPTVYGAEQPAANGITNGYAVARMYASCIGVVDGVQLLSEEAIASATAEQAGGKDRIFGNQARFGTGYMLPSPTCRMLSEHSFGHIGAGGSLGFADREAAVGFGYVQNQLGTGLTGEPRTERILDALQRSLAA